MLCYTLKNDPDLFHTESNKSFVTNWHKIQGLESNHKILKRARHTNNQCLCHHSRPHNADRVLNECMCGYSGWGLKEIQDDCILLEIFIWALWLKSKCESVRERESEFQSKRVYVATQRYFQLNHIFMLGDICVLDQSPVTCSSLVINRRAGSTDAFTNSADCVVRI